VRDYLVGRFGAEVELIESGGGAFEITRGGAPLFSKKKLGRFPTNDEIEEFGNG
jgi:predicted Rdx family selenoprotein